MGQVGQAIKRGGDNYLVQKVKAKIDYDVNLAMWTESLSKENQELSNRAVLMKWYSHEHSYRPTTVFEEYAIAEANWQWGGGNLDGAQRTLFNKLGDLPAGSILQPLAGEAAKEASKAADSAIKGIEKKVTNPLVRRRRVKKVNPDPGDPDPFEWVDDDEGQPNREAE